MTFYKSKHFAFNFFSGKIILVVCAKLISGILCNLKMASSDRNM